MTDITTANPLLAPYPTGSYLIFDSTDGKTNFRCALDLPERPYRASGSHQLNLDDLDAALRTVYANAPVTPPTLYLVDLRQESHGFVDMEGTWGWAVSWYADNDWSNVGKSDWWVQEEERLLLRLLAHEQIGHVFTIEDDPGDNRGQERQLPVSEELVPIVGAFDERRASQMLQAPSDARIVYERLPVTDHCAPTRVTLRLLQALRERVGPDDWVHFHCHGGDGRTTTFLALWDMLCWEGPLPALEEFEARQCLLFPYCLNPDGCADCKEPDGGWKASLAEVRWTVLDTFLGELQR